MNRFGFSISRGRQIDFNANDKSIAEYIYSREPSSRSCIECGSCSATCTAGNFTGFSLRQLQVLIKRGEIREVEGEISKCMLCGKCTLVCPRGVNTRDIIVLAREAFKTLYRDEF
jgi:heterodisulfide reductase subunit B